MSGPSLLARLDELVTLFERSKDSGYSPIPTHTPERPYVCVQVYNQDDVREWIALQIEPVDQNDPKATARAFEDEGIAIMWKWLDMWAIGVARKADLEATPKDVLEKVLKGLRDELLFMDNNRPSNRPRPKGPPRPMVKM